MSVPPRSSNQGAALQPEGRPQRVSRFVTTRTVLHVQDTVNTIRQVVLNENGHFRHGVGDASRDTVTHSSI